VPNSTTPIKLGRAMFVAHYVANFLLCHFYTVFWLASFIIKLILYSFGIGLHRAYTLKVKFSYRLSSTEPKFTQI